MKSLIYTPFLTVGCLLATAVPSHSESKDHMAFFEKEVRPVLAENCYECHGADKQKGGLRLDSLEAILSGGESGAALVPGKADESLLVHAIRREDPDFEMPPKKPLTEREIQSLTEWVSLGAPWPGVDADLKLTKAQKGEEEHEFTDEERSWWSYQPLKKAAVPAKAGGEWAKNDIDRFVYRELAEAGLEPAPQADRRELIRRAYFDLIGLPPSPEAVEAFVIDKRPDAWPRLIDALLEDPRYGERWGQHWLDVVRYAESDGYNQDAFRPDAWPYRDFVVQSFNNDKPYDQFVREQLAGDQIDPDNPDVMIGTAYLRNGIYEYNQRNVRMHWELIVDELTALTGEAFLGLSVQCAQCHDHKFDPILQEDYYRLKAFLAPVKWRFDLPLTDPKTEAEYEAKLAKYKEATKEIQEQIDAILEPKIISKQEGNAKMFPDDIKAMRAKPESERTPYEQQLVDLMEIQVRYERERFSEEKSLKPEEKEKLKALREQLKPFEDLKPKPLPVAFVATDVGPEAPDVLLKSRKGEKKIGPGFMTLIQPGTPDIPKPEGIENTTGRRLALANWITRPDNQLSTRVIANRVWQHHFGYGIVRTPNDFGHLGEEPTHPELLDYLALRFVEGGWKMKPLHRLIMTSAAYQQTARVEPNMVAKMKDPENRLLWRFPVRRLQAEEVRDAMLAVSGELETTGPGTVSVDGDQPRRSIYVKKMRNRPDELLKAFDAPPGFASAPERNATTTATQSLLMVNGDWPLNRAKAFAERLLDSSKDVSPELVDRAYALAFSRPPSADERQLAHAFLKEQIALGEGESPAPKYPGENGLRPIKQMFSAAQPSGLLSDQALWLQPGSRFERLQLSGIPADTDEFTVEAVVNLDALYDSADVRTLAARWDGDQKHSGWTFGVTSEKSRYDPRNFIMQLIGEDFQGAVVYEVVASDLRVPLNKPTYLAATVSVTPTPEHKTEGVVTFYMKDLSDPDSPLQVKQVRHPIMQRLNNPKEPLILGGRGQTGRSLWDGQVARFSMAPGALKPEQLLIQARPAAADRYGDWVFQADTKGEQPIPGGQWVRSAPANGPGGVPLPVYSAVTDFCHALMNANEFLYLQ